MFIYSVLSHILLQLKQPYEVDIFIHMGKLSFKDPGTCPRSQRS